MDGIVPGIDVSDCPAVIRQVPGWAEEYSAHMHQFTEREIREQHTDQKQMDVKDNTNTFGDCRAEADQSHSQLLYSHDMHFKEISHQNARDSDAQYKKERKIISSKRDISHLRYPEPSDDEEGDRSQDNSVSNVEQRHANLQKAVEAFHNLYHKRDIQTEEPQMPDKDNKE